MQGGGKAKKSVGNYLGRKGGRKKIRARLLKDAGADQKAFRVKKKLRRRAGGLKSLKSS